VAVELEASMEFGVLSNESEAGETKLKIFKSKSIWVPKIVDSTRCLNPMNPTVSFSLSPEVLVSTAFSYIIA
jgi:hypothetical protein